MRAHRLRHARAAITLRPTALPALHSLRAVVRSVISATLHGLCAVTGSAVCDNALRSFQEAASNNTTCNALHFRLRRTTADCATLRSGPQARDRSMGTISTLPSLRYAYEATTLRAPALHGLRAVVHSITFAHAVRPLR